MVRGSQLVEEGFAFFDKRNSAALRASVVRQRRTIRHSAPREVFSATYTPPPKMIEFYFAAAAAKLCEAFSTNCDPRTVHGAGVLRVLTSYSTVQKRCMKAAAWARVEFAVGFRFPRSSPSIMPSLTAQRMASYAQPLMASASGDVRV